MKVEFIRIYSKEKFPEGLKKKKFKSVIDYFFKVYDLIIRDIIIQNNLVALDLFKKDVENSFIELLNVLNEFLSKFINITFICSMDSVEKLIDIGIHKSDAEIIVDCYALSLSLNKKIMLVTLDKGILSQSDKISNILLNKIKITHPADFIE